MFKSKIFLAVFILMFSFGFLISSVRAADLQGQVNAQLQAGLEKSGLNQPKDPRVAIANIVEVFLGLLGSIFLILIAISSFNYITAAGQENKISKASSTIKGAVIGLIIVIMAYSITYFVSKRLQRAVGIQPTSANSEHTISFV